MAGSHGSPEAIAGLAAKKATQGSPSEAEDVPSDEGIPRMTPKVLQECCVQSRGYMAPDLNDVLMLQYKGFRSIEGLGAYHNVRSLFLECNGITKIQNLEVMPHLVSLYLQSNCIERMENLEKLTSLLYLNLSHNKISKVENLESLVKLETLKLAGNRITEIPALEGLASRADSLQSVDVSCNYIEDGEAYMSFWPRALPDVECLYLHHNTCSRTLKDYRRRIISGCRKIRWLDERPVPEVERLGCEAWASGGKEAEQKVKGEYYLNEIAQKKREFDNYQQVSKASAERARAQRAAQDERERAAREAATEAQKDGSLAEGWVALPEPRKVLTAPPAPACDSERQARLRARVQSFLGQQTGKSQRCAEAKEASVQSDASTDAPAEDSSPPAPEDSPLRSPDARYDDWPGPVRALPPDAVGEASQTAAVEDDDCGPTAGDPERTTIDQTTEAASVEAAAGCPFQWTAFRDRRLGRLVAEHRYDFAGAAAALSREFGAEVSASACRERYRELIRPTAFSPPARADAKQALKDKLSREAGRAKDAPEPAPEVIDEIQDWWVKGIARGPDEHTLRRRREETAAAAAKTAKAAAEAHALQVAEHAQALDQASSAAVDAKVTAMEDYEAFGQSRSTCEPMEEVWPAEECAARPKDANIAKKHEKANADMELFALD